MREEKLNAEERIEKERKEMVRRLRSMVASIRIRRGESQKVTGVKRDPLGATFSLIKSIIHNSRKAYLMP